MTIEELKNRNLIILECISGSKAYGLDTPQSDTDIKGVFLLPKPNFYGLKYIPQISNESNDIVYYELGRFMQLLAFNNPNIMELLNTPEKSVIILLCESSKWIDSFVKMVRIRWMATRKLWLNQHSSYEKYLWIISQH